MRDALTDPTVSTHEMELAFHFVAEFREPLDHSCFALIERQGIPRDVLTVYVRWVWGRWVREERASRPYNSTVRRPSFTDRGPRVYREPPRGSTMLLPRDDSSACNSFYSFSCSSVALLCTEVRGYSNTDARSGTIPRYLTSSKDSTLQD